MNIILQKAVKMLLIILLYCLPFYILKFLGFAVYNNPTPLFILAFAGGYILVELLKYFELI